MRSLHIDTEPTWRGGEQQLFHTLEGLRDRGVPATLLAQPGSPLFERALAAGLDARLFPIRGELDIAAARRLGRLLRDERFDLIHAHTPHAHAIALLARWFTPADRSPKLVVARRVDFAIRHRGDFLGLGASKYNRANAVIAVSKAVRDILIRDGVAPDRITVVYEGIDVARIERARDRRLEVRTSLRLRENERLVVNVAALTAHKGQRYLVAAVPAIRAACPEARVVIFGEGELRDELQAQARELNLGDALIFAGFQPPEEIPSILKAADAFVMSSVEEGLGTSLFDAMAAGVPIVATRAGGIPEVVHDGEIGLLVSTRDSAALAEAVVRLLKDAALARRLADAAGAFVRREGTKERMVEQTIRMYKELLAR